MTREEKVQLLKGLSEGGLQIHNIPQPRKELEFNLASNNLYKGVQDQRSYTLEEINQLNKSYSSLAGFNWVEGKMYEDKEMTIYGCPIVFAVYHGPVNAPVRVVLPEITRKMLG